MALVYFMLFVAALVSVSAGSSDALRSQKVGNEHPENPKDPKYLELAMKAYKKFWWDRYHESTELMDVTVLKVTTQMVAGLLTRLEFVVTFPFKFNCYAEVLQQKWKHFEHIDVTCDGPLP